MRTCGFELTTNTQNRTLKPLCREEEPSMVGKYYLQIFGLLDLILVVRFFNRIEIPMWPSGGPWWANAIAASGAPLLLSCIFSGFGLLFRKRWALIVSVIQFPFHIINLLLTFGFLTKLTLIWGSSFAYNLLVGVALVLEVLRLFISWRAYRHIAL